MSPHLSLRQGPPHPTIHSLLLEEDLHYLRSLGKGWTLREVLEQGSKNDRGSYGSPRVDESCVELMLI